MTGNPNKIATLLYSNLLITKEEKEIALQQNLTTEEKMEEIFKVMERRILVNCADFHELREKMEGE